MEKLTRRRIAASLIDNAVATTVSLAVETVMRKKVKSEIIHTIITPTTIAYALECAQLHNTGKTIGYRMTGLQLVSTNGELPTRTQVFKRMLYRDYVSSFQYLFKNNNFEKQRGAVLPQDTFSDTIVTLKNK